MKKYIYIIFLLTLSCCKKDQSEEKTAINSQDFFLEMTDIDKLKKTEKTKLNDSTYRIRGLVNSLLVTGYLTQNDEKIDWWEVADANGKKVAMVEYRIVDKKVFANQYKVFNDSKLDVYKSKYYTLKSDKDKVSYSFYVPKSGDIVETKANFLYSVYDIEKNKEIISSECEWVNSDNKFQCEFSVPNKNNILVSGIFFELSQTKNGEMGASEIYVRDTIKM